MSYGVEELARERIKAVSLIELFVVYLKMGLTAFGPAMMAETKKHIVKRKKWISEEEFLNGLALGQLIPGATFVSLTVYIGYKLRGVAGAVASFLGFLLPPFAVMVLLSYLYLPSVNYPLRRSCSKGWRPSWWRWWPTRFGRSGSLPLRIQKELSLPLSHGA